MDGGVFAMIACSNDYTGRSGLGADLFAVACDRDVYS